MPASAGPALRLEGKGPPDTRPVRLVHREGQPVGIENVARRLYSGVGVCWGCVCWGGVSVCVIVAHFLHLWTTSPLEIKL